MTTIKVLVVEDEPLTAEDIRDYLTNASYSVTALAYNKEQAIKALAEDTPDVVLLDINLGGKLDGFELARILNEEHQVPFIFLTSYAHQGIIEQAKLTRPVGYILKPFDGKDLYSSIEIGLYNFSQRGGPQQLSLSHINAQLPSPLTDKEFEILKSLCQGRTNKQMAEQHFISINTVKTHLKSLYEKLDAHSRSEVIVKVREYNGRGTG